MDHLSPNEYRTGGSVPPKPHGGLFAVGLLIFLSVSGMFLTVGFLALRSEPFVRTQVLASLETPDGTPSPADAPHMEGEVTAYNAIGITCQSISEFCEKYYQLPSGIYILQVEKGSPTDRHGVMPGDVLIQVNGKQMRYPASLEQLLAENTNGKPLEMTFSRKGKIYTVYIVPGA